MKFFSAVSYLNFIIIFFVIIQFVNAQNLSELKLVGKPESKPSEIISKEIKDSNGEVCAGIIIIHDLDGLTYDSYNKIVKVNSKPGSDILYISPTEQVITVYKSGYQPLKIIINELGIRLKSGDMWQISITVDKKLELIPINIITNPIGAEIIIDDISRGTGTSIDVSEGEHEIRIEMKGYKSIIEKINVSVRNTLFNYTLKAIEQEIVEIRSEPKEAIIYLDGINEGVTDNQIFRFPGKYKLRLTKSGYLDVEQEIDVLEKGNNKLNFKLIKNISTLSLSITPTDAEVEINNKNYGSSREIELAPGSHLLVVKKSGYRELKETITLQLNQAFTKTITLEPITGSLQVKALPIDASVRLIRSGKEINKWVGAKILKDLIIGEYTLEAEYQGFEKWTKVIKIIEGITVAEEIKLVELVNKSLESNLSGCSPKVIYAGKTYNTVQIGSQCWLKENLDVGTMVQVTQDQTNNSTIEKYCYNNNANNCATYGGLYQWAEAVQYKNVATNTTSPNPGFSGNVQGICPPGWHMPNKAEFETLRTAVNNNGNTLKAVGQGSGDGLGTNSNGFSGLLAGYSFSNGNFNNIGYDTSFWSSTEHSSTNAYNINLWDNDSNINMFNYSKRYGFSVRCVKD